MRLNGWVRLGIVASVLWAVGAYLYQNNAVNERASRAYDHWAKQCMAVERLKNSDKQDFEKCYAMGEEMMMLAFKEAKGEAAALALIPIPLAWLFGWLIVVIWRWVAKGFQKG